MYSFDVYDTLITRNTATPQGIFAIMQEELALRSELYSLPEYIVTNFYELRIHSENLARLNNESNGIEEVSLEDIYCAMAMTGCVSAEDQKLLCELERRTEIDNTIAIEENIDKVKKLISQGEEVILISDMYLDVKTLRTILINANEVFKELQLFVSSEYGKRKTSGNLYRLINRIKGVDYTQWIHMGDNMYQDIEVPMSLGIKVIHYPVGKLLPLEDRLLQYYGNNRNLQLSIGAAKNIRRANPLHTTAGKMGCSFSGPIIYSYVEWVLSEAVRKGIHRLYFIARDGYLIKRVADILIQRNHLSISTYYIYGSRKAWRLPSLDKECFDLYTILKWSNTRKIKSLENLAEFLGIPCDELISFMPEGCKNKKAMITNQGLQYIANKLNNDQHFKDYLINKMRGIRDLTVDYLRQEIDVSNDNFAFVDVSGGGLTQGCLSNLIKSFYCKPIHTFFFKIDRVNLNPNSINDTFLPSYLENNLVIEMICRAPHGQTIGYEEKDGRVVPILATIEDEAYRKHGFYEYQRGIESYAMTLSRVQPLNDAPSLTTAIILKVFHYIAKEPDSETLEFFASFPNSETGRDNTLIEYAPRLTREDIENIFLKRTYEYLDDYYRGTNFEYSLLRCNKEEAEYVDYCKQMYSTAIGKLARQEKTNKEELHMKQYGSAGRFPCEILEENIVIYGAGKFGQGLYKRITDLNLSCKVSWVDKEYEKYNRQGLSMIESPQMIETKNYDQLIIAVASKDLADDIKLELMERGVPESKIIWMTTNPYEQYYLRW